MTSRPSRLVGEVEADVLVLGGGLAGLATATAVARAGRKVVVLESGSVGAGPSGADLGHVATGLGRPYLRAAETWGRERTRALWEWHRESHQRLLDLLTLVGEDCGYRKQGGFLVARTRAEAIDLADSEDALRDDGFAGEFLDHYMLESRFGIRGCSGAYWAADDGEVDGLALLRNLAALAEARGASIFEAGRAEEISAEAGRVVARTAHGRVRAAAGVVAVGAQVGTLLPGIAPLLRSFPARRLAFETEGRGAVPSPARTVGGALAWRAGDDLRAASFGRPEARPSPDSGSPPSGTSSASVDLTGGFEELARGVADLLPARPRTRGRWSGLLHTGPDDLPLVGECAGASLFAILGLGALGHAWAFAAARRAADWLNGRSAASSPLGSPP